MRTIDRKIDWNLALKAAIPCGAFFIVAAIAPTFHGILLYALGLPLFVVAALFAAYAMMQVSKETTGKLRGWCRAASVSYAVTAVIPVVCSVAWLYYAD